MKKLRKCLRVVAICLVAGSCLCAAMLEEESTPGVLSADTFLGLKFRSLGPALMSGRVSDLAVNPANPSQYYVAAASGGVWKTVNSGTTWTPVFDKQASFSIGCLALDPGNPHTIWVGTGENNSQRSVAWGDGVYRSDDGGENWVRLGLKDSEHIGRILIDPRDSNVVYVAAQGPLWGPGGDRGLYKTTDGGKSWDRILFISENTGVNEVLMDPRYPDILYASAYQRRRHVWTLINGGPESAIYKSTDGGKNWRKLTRGLPEVDLGRIGMAVSPANPDVLYAIVEAADGKGGVFRSVNRGETWEKRSDYMSSSPQYYNELICDPEDIDTVYSMDTWMHVSVDGGKTFEKVGEASKHVDNHALWIDPSNTDYLLAGCDGGLYESFDRGKTWHYKANLPITQFYRVEVDNSEPFYFVYGGTQDNMTLGGPSRTKTVNGIVNSDWFVVTGGDGFVSRIDPVDPNIVYGESQYGVLVRHDRRSGEKVEIRPQEGPNDPPNRWNWDSPLLISPHSHTRLYFASQRLYRSDDRGNSWTAISGDLTRQIDRDQLKVMDRIWPVDAVAKNDSTSFFGNIVALSESSLVEGLIYVGTDDGLIQVTEDGGRSWRRIESFPGVPEMTYVAGLAASRHDRDTVYVTFDNHKKADFKPYVLRSADRGRNWESLVSDLPGREVAYTLKEDPLDRNLLFIGCEFGVYFSPDGGGRWIKLKGDLPTIAVRDIALQERENDLVLGTFGRGFFVLDDYSPLRRITKETLEREAVLFPVRRAYAYIESNPLGGRHKANLGDSFYTAENPPFGAVFTYYLKDELKTRKERRHELEQAAFQKGEPPPYPSVEELRAEEREQPPRIILTVSDPAGNLIRQLDGPIKKGFQRVAWDLRYPPSVPAVAEPEEVLPWESPVRGSPAAPGRYQVSLEKRVDGVSTQLSGPIDFEVLPINLNTLAAVDQQAVLAFNAKVANLQRAALGARDLAKESRQRLQLILVSLKAAPAETTGLLNRAMEIDHSFSDLQIKLEGDRLKEKRNLPSGPSIVERVQRIVNSQWGTTAPPTQTAMDSYAVAAAEFEPLLERLKQLVEVELEALDQAMEKVGAPWTPGRVPEWKPE